VDKAFNKEDVLNRPEIPMDEDINPRYFVTEGDYPVNQFWGSDGRCYVPVRYKQIRYKLRVNIKHRDLDEQ